MRFRQAIVAALEDEMEADPSVMVMGEDIAVAGGPFKTSEGLLDKFGPNRVRDTPISEMAFTGAGVGAAIAGLRPVIEIMFMEFLGVALDQLVTGAAKMHYLSKGQLSVPLTVRASVGSGTGFGSQHSQTLENWVTATPGLTVVTMSTPQNAYGILRAAIQSPGPTMVLEPRNLYAVRGEVQRGAAGLVELGKAEVVRQGTAVTIVTMGQLRTSVLEAVEASGIDAEIIDLITLAPWDRTTVLDSVAKTHRLVVVEEAPESGGWGSEIVAAVTRELFSSLSAAPFRITTPNVPVPYSRALESRYLPQPDEIARQLTQYQSTGTVPAPWWVLEGLSK
ncbi:MAG: alpha-ketoacid dehydrogenase subunit beta [Actinobacteria bacterium]|nr:alpha-ketoacid dehydrogenase subunit beta [Actinomycetota bacterium]